MLSVKRTEFSLCLLANVGQNKQNFLWKSGFPGRNSANLPYFMSKVFEVLVKMKRDIKQHQAPDCSDFGKDPHSLICQEKKKEQKIYKFTEED